MPRRQAVPRQESSAKADPIERCRGRAAYFVTADSWVVLVFLAVVAFLAGALPSFARIDWYRATPAGYLESGTYQLSIRNWMPS